jgi:hypothetical protein
MPLQQQSRPLQLWFLLQPPQPQRALKTAQLKQQSGTGMST